MTEAASKALGKTAETSSSAPQVWRPFESLRGEIDRVLTSFDRHWHSPFRTSMFDLEPLFRSEISLVAVPAVDISEKDTAYSVTVELPGMDEKNIDVQIVNGNLTIKGEKKEEAEENEKGYHVHERYFGSFERSFRLPETVDSDKIESAFKKGVLTVVLPKKPQAQKAAKKIEIKAA
jgi:HSP20 family protein